MTLQELNNIDVLSTIAMQLSQGEMHLAMALKVGVKPELIQPIFQSLTPITQELTTAMCILSGGYPINMGDDNAKAAWFSLTRSQQVSQAKKYIDRMKGMLEVLQSEYLNKLPTKSDCSAAKIRFETAYGNITHLFDFKQEHLGPFPDTVVHPHGVYTILLNRLLFVAKYWRDWLNGAAAILTPTNYKIEWSDAVIEYTNGIACVHHCMSLAAGNIYLPIENDSFSRAGRIMKLLGHDLQHRFKVCTQHWVELGLRSRVYKDAGIKMADAWFHTGLAWNELMKMPSSLKFAFDWDILEF